MLSADDPANVAQIPYRLRFPWLSLFQAIAISFSVRQLIVAVGAIAAFALSQLVIDGVAGSGSAIRGEIQIGIPPGAYSEARLGELVGEIAQPWSDVWRSVWNLFPAFDSRSTIESPGLTIEIRRGAKANHWVDLGVLVWQVILWSLFGLILCRLAARRFARGENGSFRKGVQFGLTRWVRGLVAPLIPSAAAGLILAAMVAAAAIIGFLPWVNGFLLVIASPLLLTGGLMAGFLIVATLLGWPLMVAAIAYDDCDGFGGLSRSYSQWTGRPWYFVWLWTVAAGVGMIAMSLAVLFGEWAFYLCSLAIKQGVGQIAAAESGRRAILAIVRLLIHAFAISYFWTSATIVYGLLRQSVDWMPCDTVAPDDDERPRRDPLPVVGIPAMEPSATGT